MDKYADEMSLAEWQNAIANLAALSSPLAIDFTGGEPTIHPNFLEIVEYCRSKKVDWFMTTNGSTLSRTRFVERLVAAEPLKIDISVDSGSGEVHDRARGVAGSLEKIEQGIRGLVATQATTGRKFPIRIKVTVHRLNAHELSPVVRWAESVGVTSVDFNPVQGLWRDEQIEQLSVRDQDLNELTREIQTLIEIKSRGAPIETSDARLLGMIEHFSGTTDFGSAPCRDPVRNYIIKAGGDVLVCGCSPPIGNVREQSASDIWHGQMAKNARKKSLNCSLKVAKAKGASSCMAEKSIADDLRRALLLVGFGSNRAQ